MKWKIFQCLKFLFRHSSNSRKLSRQKFHNELAYLFTAYYGSKNADWNHQQLTDGGILANRNSANHPAEISWRTRVCIHCVLRKQKRGLKSTTTNGWRRFGQSEQRKSSVLFPIHQLFCIWSVKEMYHALLPKTDYRDKGRGHDRRLVKCMRGISKYDIDLVKATSKTRCMVVFFGKMTKKLKLSLKWWFI